jgi:hypothetical protein
MSPIGSSSRRLFVHVAFDYVADMTIHAPVVFNIIARYFNKSNATALTLCGLEPNTGGAGFPLEVIEVNSGLRHLWHLKPMSYVVPRFNPPGLSSPAGRGGVGRPP